MGTIQADVLAVGAVRDDAVAAPPANVQDGARRGSTRVHHRHPAVGQDVGKQAQLALQVGVHGPVVVQVVAAEIGESRRRHLHPVQAVLGEAVAGGFHGQELDAVFRQPPEGAVQVHRTGRGQVARDPEPRRVEAEGSQAGGPVPQARPDLAQEVGYRGLAVGARDGGDRIRLRSEELGRHEGKPAARVVVDQMRRPAVRRQLEMAGRQHGRGAALQRFGDEGAAVDAGPRQGGE